MSSLRQPDPRSPGAPDAPSSGAIGESVDLDASELIAAAPAAAEACKDDQPSRWGVLRHRHYRNIILSQFVSNCGNWMEMMGLLVVFATITGSVKWAGYLAAAQLGPFMVLGLLGGVVADRVDRKRLLLFTQTLLMLTAAGVAVVYWLTLRGYKPEPGVEHAPAGLYWLLGLAVLQGVVMSFNMPAWTVLTPRLVPRDELIKAVTVNGIQFNLSRVIGPALAGLVMAAWDVQFLFIVNTLSFFVVIFTVRTTPPNPPPPHDGKHPWRQILDAGAFIFTHRGALAVFMATVVMSALAAPLVRFLTNFVMDVYGYDAEYAEVSVSWLLAVQGVGAVIGGLALRIVPPWYPKHHLIPVAILGNGVFITLFAVFPYPSAGFAMMLIIGFFWIWAFNQSWAALQHLAPDAMRGRVMAVASVASFGSTALGSLVGGKLGDALDGPLSKAHSTQAAVGVLSLLLIAGGIVMLMHRVPEVDGLPRVVPGKPASKNLLHAIFAREHRPGK